MKNITFNTAIIVISSLALNVANASEHDGGLMTELMSKKYHPSIIANPEAQARLALIKIAEDTHQNGGLMKQLMSARYPEKIISGEKIQKRLALIKIPDGNN